MFDHLEGGALDKRENNLNFQMDTASVPITNAQPERDFGMLDNLMRNRPRATTMALEGLVMCATNKVSRWRDGLSKEKKEMMIRCSMKSKKDHRRQYLQRIEKIKEKRAEKLIEGKDLKEKKEIGLRNEKKKLTKELEGASGLWESVGEMKEKLAEFKSEKEKLSRLKVQIKFREKVIGHQKEHKSLSRKATDFKPTICKLEIASKEVAIIENEVIKSFSEIIIDREEFKRAKLH